MHTLCVVCVSYTCGCVRREERGRCMEVQLCRRVQWCMYHVFMCMCVLVYKCVGGMDLCMYIGVM